MSDSGNVLGIYVGLSWTPLLLKVGYENDATRLAAQVHAAAVEAAAHNHPITFTPPTPEEIAARRQHEHSRWHEREAYERG